MLLASHKTAERFLFSCKIHLDFNGTDDECSTSSLASSQPAVSCVGACFDVRDLPHPHMNVLSFRRSSSPGQVRNAANEVRERFAAGHQSPSSSLSLSLVSFRLWQMMLFCEGINGLSKAELSMEVRDGGNKLMLSMVFAVGGAILGRHHNKSSWDYS